MIVLLSFKGIMSLNDMKTYKIFKRNETKIAQKRLGGKQNQNTLYSNFHVFKENI